MLPALTIRTTPEHAVFSNQIHYLASMCHEIKTPLAAIVSLSHILSDVTCSGFRKHQCAQMLRDSSDMLSGLLGDLLDSSKLESGKIQLEHLAFSPEKVIREALHIVSYKAEGKGLRLTLDMGSDVPGSLIGDPLRIRQIVVNLLTNAIKFTDSGSIEVFLNAEDVSAGDCRLAIAVADCGIGMTTLELEKIFHPYVQANSSISRYYGGTGLGLSISRSLAHLMKGDIVVSSRPGEGSCFTAYLLLEKHTDK